MRHIPLTTSAFSQSTRPLPPGGVIEWEELPSLAGSLVERLVVSGDRHHSASFTARAGTAAFEPAVRSGQPWDDTRPADLEPARPPQPFHEPFNGLAIREVSEPDVFRHFFGALRSA